MCVYQVVPSPHQPLPKIARMYVLRTERIWEVCTVTPAQQMCQPHNGWHQASTWWEFGFGAGLLA
jgi:hypothetical protein